MTVKKDQSHRWTQQHLSEYIDHELSEPQRARLEKHLAECDECAHSLQTMQQTVEWLHQLPTQPLLRSFMLSKDQVSVSEPKLSWLFPYFRSGAVVATLLLVIVLSADLFQSVFTAGQLTQAPVAPAFQATRPLTSTLAGEPVTGIAKVSIPEEREKSLDGEVQPSTQDTATFPALGGLLSESQAEEQGFDVTDATEVHKEMIAEQWIAPEQPSVEGESDLPRQEAEPEQDKAELEAEDELMPAAEEQPAPQTFGAAPEMMRQPEEAFGAMEQPAAPSPTAIAPSEIRDSDVVYERQTVLQSLWRIVELGLAGFIMISLIAMWLLRKRAPKR